MNIYCVTVRLMRKAIIHPRIQNSMLKCGSSVALPWACQAKFKDRRLTKNTVKFFSIRCDSTSACEGRHGGWNSLQGLWRFTVSGQCHRNKCGQDAMLSKKQHRYQATSSDQYAPSCRYGWRFVSLLHLSKRTCMPSSVASPDRYFSRWCAKTRV